MLSVIPSVLAVIIYGQTYNFGYTLDDFLIFNTIGQTSDGFQGILELFGKRFNISEYRPVTMASYQLERIFFGSLKPGTAHLVNLFFYIASIFLLGFFMHVVIPENFKNRNFLIATILLLFSAHPVHANVVASLKSRDTLLSMFFMTGSLIVLFRMIKRKTSWRLLLLFGILFLVSFMSKRDSVGLLFMAPITVMIFDPKKWKLALTTFIIGFVGVLLYNMIMLNFAPIPQGKEITDVVRFSENPMNWDIVSRIAAFFSTTLLNLKMFVWPVDYLFYYGYDTFPFPFKGLLLILSIAVYIALLAAFIFVFKKNKLLAFGLLFMGANLIYCSNLVAPTAGIIAARLIYIASFGFCIVLAVILNSIPNSRLKYILTAMIIVVFAYYAHDRAGDWRNFETLAQADMPKLKNSHEANRIAGAVYLHRADSTTSAELAKKYYDLSLKHYQRANAIYDGNWQVQHFEGVLYYERGNYEKAIPRFEKSFELNDEFNAYTSELLGDAYYSIKDYPAARKTYYYIWQNDRNRQYMLNKISTTYYDQGNIDAVRKFNDSLMHADPGLYTPYENFGYLHLLDQDTLTAVSYFRESLARGLKDPKIVELVNQYE